jgi:hypothetical protein
MVTALGTGKRLRTHSLFLLHSRPWVLIVMAPFPESSDASFSTSPTYCTPIESCRSSFGDDHLGSWLWLHATVAALAGA